MYELRREEGGRESGVEAVSTSTKGAAPGGKGFLLIGEPKSPDRTLGGGGDESWKVVLELPVSIDSEEVRSKEADMMGDYR